MTFGKARIIDASFLYTLWQESPEPWLKDILFQSLQGAFPTDQEQKETTIKDFTGEIPLESRQRPPEV